MSQAALMRRIEREALKAARQHKKVFKLAQRSANRKAPTHCAECGIKSDYLRQYVDDSNIALTTSAKPLCPVCYRKIYGNE